MFEIRIHGRGGQGAVTAAELLSVAAFDEGRHAQAFPTFGSERTGAPVVSFCRIDDAADPDPRADRRTGRPGRPGPDPAAPGEGLRRRRPDGLPAGEHLTRLRRARASGSSLERLRRAPAGRRCPRPSSPASTLGRPLPNARPARRVRRPDRGGVARAGGRARSATGSPARWAAANARAAEAGHAHVVHDPGGGPCLASWRARGRSPATVARCRPQVDRGLPDLAADPHRGGALRPGAHRRAGAVRVPHGGVGVRRHVGVHRRLGRGRPHLHRDRQPGAAVHGRGAVQRLRSRAADRDDGGQPGRSAPRSTSGTTTPTRCRCATRAGSSCSPSPTRRPSTCTSRPSGWPRSCRCR